jgi:hypothetical protein
MRQDRINKQLYDCKCVDYGQIDPKKIERLKKHRQKQICTWKELSVFRDNEIKNEPDVEQNKGTKPMFPPIFNVSMQCATDYKTLHDTELNSSFSRGKKSHKLDAKMKSDGQAGHKSKRSKVSSSFSSLPPL